jgi:His/Glu/Gln/Arg/opine family amino acid ABC transporter permease subunit
MLSGLLVTLGTAGAATLATVVWALVPALMRSTHSRVLNGLARAYVEVFRGTPVLVQLFLVFFGLAVLGILIGPWTASVLVLTLNQGSFLAESYRSGIQAVPRGHREVATAMGMSPLLVFRRVVAPEALRLIVPAIGNITVMVLLTTPISSLIGNQELLYQAVLIQSRTDDWSVYLLATLMYTAVALVLSVGNSALERHLRLAT